MFVLINVKCRRKNLFRRHSFFGVVFFMIFFLATIKNQVVRCAFRFLFQEENRTFIRRYYNSPRRRRTQLSVIIQACFQADKFGFRWCGISDLSSPKRGAVFRHVFVVGFNDFFLIPVGLTNIDGDGTDKEKADKTGVVAKDTHHDLLQS